MKRKMLIASCVMVAMLFLTGCASIVSKTAYNVTFTTNAPNAKIKVRNASGGYVISQGNSPLVVKLKTSKGFFEPASYQCEVKAGDKKQTRTITPDFNLWFVGNIFLGGFIGMAVDGWTGACYKLDDTLYVHFSEFED